MRQISDAWYRISNGRTAAVALFIFMAFTALVLPGQSRESASISGETGSPDLSFYYTRDELYEMAEAYGEEGRAAYIRARFTFDVAWPIVYTFFLSTTISWIILKTSSPDERIWRLNLLPVLGALFDYLENVSTSLVMYRYPSLTPTVDSLASWFTLLKWLAIVGSFLILFLGLVIVTKNSIGKRTNE
jgi:hypothetical protein